MSRQRSYKQQFRHALRQHAAHGQKKHAAPQELKDVRVYGDSRYSGLENVVDQFAAFMEKEYPQVKWLYNITNEHTTAWLKSMEHLSPKSFDEYRSRLSKLHRICADSYSKCRHTENWGTIHIEPPKAEKVRAAVMNRDDFTAIRDSIIAGKRSDAWIAMEITSRVGIRVKGCHWLSGKDIDLEKWTVYVCKKGAKNGRARTIPIRPQDREFFRWLKERCPNDRIFQQKNGRVLTEGAINKCIRNHMKKLGISEQYPCSTLHAVRKMYARERMAELRGPAVLSDKKAEMKAFDIVSAELGHGNNRYDLYKTYVLGK